MRRGDGIQCEVPKKRDEGPPEGFVDNVVYRYRLDENGNKVLIGTMPAFPEGWDTSTNPFKKKEQGEDRMSKDKGNVWARREDREQVIKIVKQVIAEGGSVSKVAKELNVPVSTVYRWLAQEKKKAQKQAQEPVPTQVDSQEPERENQEPANQSVAQEKPEITVREQGFGPEDDEPIPYWPVDLRDLIAELRDDLDLERKKVANLEKKMDLLMSAAVSSPTPETRLAKLLVAVFRELETGIGAKE